jgi:hypothetical protein
MIPWLMVGIHKALQGKTYAIGIIALTLGIMFTTGYFGMNIIFIQWIVLFCLIEFILFDAQKNNWLRSISFVIGGFGLFLFIWNLPILETISWLGLNFENARVIAISPFTYAANFHSLYTLIFPNNLSSFVPDASGGHRMFLFFGSSLVIFLMYSITQIKKNPIVLLFLSFAILCFLSLLSEAYLAGRIATTIIPFYQSIRWHGWDISLVIFFLILSSLFGIKLWLEHKELSRGKILALSGFIIVAVISCYKLTAGLHKEEVKYFTYPQIYIWICLFTILFFFNKKVHGAVLLVVIVIISVAEIFFVSQQIISPFSNYLYVGNYTYLQENKNTELLKLEAGTKNDFIGIKNKRIQDITQENPQYFYKTPSMYGYTAYRYQSITLLQKLPIYPVIADKIFYQIDATSLPIQTNDVRIDDMKLTPNLVEIEIDVVSKTQNIVWSSPFTTNWQLDIDGKKGKTYPNRFGLTQFTVQEGIHTIRFIYSPPYIIPSIVLTLLSIGISISLLTRKSRHKMSIIRQRSKQQYAKKQRR